MRICLIGNSGTKSLDKGGQTTKLRLYKSMIEKEGIDIFFIDLENFFHHPVTIFYKIRKGIKKCDRIVFISGERACKLLVPYILRINKKFNRIFVLPLVGSGLLHYSIDFLTDDKIYDFFVNKDYSCAKKHKNIEKYLKKIDYILPETLLMKDIYETYYHINNCVVLNNFRNSDLTIASNPKNKLFKIIFLSRVMSLKGIFDLLESIKFLNYEYQLDIYGTKHFDSFEDALFNSYLNDKISYKGPIDNSSTIKVIQQYDLFVFPTRATYEGTPGVIAEALLAGTPILTSNFPQAPFLLNDGFDSIFYEMFNIVDLKNKLEWCFKSKEKLRKMRKNAVRSSIKYTYKYNRDIFLEYVCGSKDNGV